MSPRSARRVIVGPPPWTAPAARCSLPLGRDPDDAVGQLDVGRRRRAGVELVSAGRRRELDRFVALVVDRERRGLRDRRRRPRHSVRRSAPRCATPRSRTEPSTRMTRSEPSCFSSSLERDIGALRLDVERPVDLARRELAGLSLDRRRRREPCQLAHPSLVVSFSDPPSPTSGRRRGGCRSPCRRYCGSSRRGFDDARRRGPGDHRGRRARRSPTESRPAPASTDVARWVPSADRRC